MRTLNRYAVLTCLCGAAAFGQDAIHTSTLTFGFGGATTNQYIGSSSSNSPDFKMNYEFRWMRYLALEAGGEMLLPKTVTGYQPIYLSGINLISNAPSPTTYVPTYGRARVGTLPFGVKGILPVMQGRMELFAGVGGAYGWTKFSYWNSWYVQGSLGARYAIDKQHHFWIGTSGRYYNNFGRVRQSWFGWTGDFGVRF